MFGGDKETQKIIEEYDDCDLSIANNTTRDVTSIDEEMRKIGVQALAKYHHKEETVEDYDDDTNSNSTNENSNNGNDEGRNKHLSGGEPPQSPSSLTNDPTDPEEQGSSDYQTVMRLLGTSYLRTF